MLFNSLEFLVFFPLVVLGYFLIPDRWKHYWLLLASYYFYMSWNAKYALLLLFSTLVTYACARLLEKTQRQGGSERKKKYIVLASLLLNLSLLVYFKYFNFLLASIESLFALVHVRLRVPQFDILLPVGISFFTFQALGYTIDVYRGDIPAEHDFFRYALFVSFFPQLVAGPIERSGNLLKQLAVYKELIDAGVPSIMLSHSSLNGKKMHENTELIRRLREDLGFKGVILSDWESLHNCSGASDKENVILCVNAGCDMLMEGEHYAETRDYLIEAINEESIPMERIDEAVTHILQLKMDLGLFRDPFLENRVPSYEWNSDHAHSVARELAQKSMVPLVLPEDGPITLTEGMKVYVMGPAADDSGVLCGDRIRDRDRSGADGRM